MQIPDFKSVIDAGGFATLTWQFLTASGKSTLPPGIVAQYNNSNGNMLLTLASVTGIDPDPMSRIKVPPQIDSTGLIITAQVGDTIGGEKYLVQLSIPLSNGDYPRPWNHLSCDTPN